MGVLTNTVGKRSVDRSKVRKIGGISHVMKGDVLSFIFRCRKQESSQQGRQNTTGQITMGMILDKNS